VCLKLTACREPNYDWPFASSAIVFLLSAVLNAILLSKMKLVRFW
jgi:hypothetical protein